MMSFNHVYLAKTENRYSFTGFTKGFNEALFVVVGAPLDMASSYRGGSSEAPRAVREASRSLELCTALSNIDMEAIGFHDAGDIVIAPGDIIESMKRIESVVRGILESGKRVFIIGGEHTVTLSAFKAFSSMYSDACLIVFDAHADLRDEYLGSRYSHASVLRRIIEEAKPGKVVLIGARAVSREEIEYIKASDRSRLEVVKVVGRVTEDKIKEVSKVIEVCRSRPKYVSVDIDFIDPAYAPGVQTPEPLGATPTEFFELISRVVDEHVYALDIVEITPPYDKSEITAFLGAKIIIEVAGLILKKLGGGANCW
jgi:agmatinase